MGWKGFILFAEMRTGSNHLEESLNQAAGLTCYGEAFNPNFIGGPNRPDLCGIPFDARKEDPAVLLHAMVAETEGLPGFRFFHDHDPRILDLLMEDPLWAKVILRRTPLESFVSEQIARATKQWRITNLQHRRFQKVVFDPDAFAAYRARIEGFRSQIRHRLRVAGQVPFEIDYSEILNVDMLNGLLTFLGVADRLSAPSGRLKRQNPEPLRDKVTNPDAIDAVLTQSGEAAHPAPHLAPVLADFRVNETQLLVRIPGVPVAALPGYASAAPLPADQLRPWLNRTKGHRVITAVSHPVARALRLARDHGLASDIMAMVEAVKHGTCGDPSCRPQAELLAALAQEMLPDEVLRASEEDVPELADLYTPEIESGMRDIYNWDYRAFGYGKWRRPKG